MNGRKRGSLALAVLLCAALLAGSLELDAARGAGPVFEVYIDALEQYDLDVAFNPATGSYLVAWSSTQDSYTQDLWARAVLMDGTLLPAINLYSTANQKVNKLSIAADTSRGQFLVVSQLVAGISTNWVQAMLVDWNGSPFGTTLLFSTGAYWNSGAGPSVVYNPQADEYLIVYEDTNDTNCAVAKVYAYRLDAAGLSILSSAEVGGCTANQYSLYARAAYYPGSNQYQVVYINVDTTGGMVYLRTRWLSADLSQLGPETVLASSTYMRDFSIINGPDGFLVTYTGKDASNRPQVYSQYLDSGGNLLGNPIQVTGEQIEQFAWSVPRAAFIGSLGYVVTWDFLASSTLPDSFDSYYRLLRGHPEPPPSPQMVLADGENHQTGPLVSCAPDMQCLLLFRDDSSGDYDIYARQLILQRQSLPLVVK